MYGRVTLCHALPRSMWPAVYKDQIMAFGSVDKKIARGSESIICQEMLDLRLIKQ